MMVVITYDVNTESEGGRSRLRKVAKQCVNYGQRVQNSVFECKIEPAKFVEVKATLLKLIDEDRDSLRFYQLGSNYQNRIEHYGAKKTYNIDAPLFL